MKLWIKILIGLFLGALVGFLLGENAIYLRPIGSLFLNAINMIIVLLIFSSMTVGITSIHDPAKLGRVGGKTVGIYLLTTALAITAGILMGFFSGLGENLHLVSQSEPAVKTSSLSEMLLNIIPSNPIQAMAHGQILQVIVFAIFLGFAINFSGDKGQPLLKVLESTADVMYRLTSIVMAFSPIGVFGIMAWAIGTLGWALIVPLLKFLFAYYFVCLFHFLVVYGSMLHWIARLSFRQFMRGMRDAVVMAFSTGSSAATLPVAMHCLQENLGVSKNIASFVLPMGLTMNMNGTAIYQAMSALFLSQAYDLPLTASEYVVLVFTVVFSAIGTAGIPGAGLIMLSTVLSSVGLPLEGLVLLAGIDRLRDMATTVLNIMGDAAVTVLIAKKEGELNERKYTFSERVSLEEAAS